MMLTASPFLNVSSLWHSHVIKASLHASLPLHGHEVDVNWTSRSIFFKKHQLQNISHKAITKTDPAQTCTYLKSKKIKSVKALSKDQWGWSCLKKWKKFNTRSDLQSEIITLEAVSGGVLMCCYTFMQTSFSLLCVCRGFIYSLSCLCLKIINGSCWLFLMEEREQNKLCHLFMGDLGDESEREKAGEHYQL